MIFDAEHRDEGWFRDRTFDVCVVGSGPAGIALARSLAGHGRDVGLFEAGGETLTAESQDLYKGDIVGVRYWALDKTRLRFFGGSSNHWGGWSRPLDAWDFVPNRVNPDSGWPIAKADLDGYAAETDKILDLEPNDPITAGGKLSFNPLEPISFRFSPPTRFGTKYRDELASSTRIRLFLNANLVGVDVDGSRRNVTELRFRSFKRGDTFAIRAKQFVLCLGGIENARLLLTAQLGNRSDMVGRHFCEHLVFTVGDLLLKTKRRLPKFLGPTPEFIRSAGTLNFGLRVVKLPQPAKSYLTDLKCSSSIARTISEWIGTDLGCDRPGRLRIACEQALNPNSRVRLTDMFDRFGLRQVALDWQISEIDLRTIRTAALECSKVFATRDIGRVRLLPWVTDQAMDLPSIDQDEAIGMHHMCTTRMSSDPWKGVVNANCRVHEIENLYLAGSSVFATAGHSNPTYTIVQLALRLGDHLNDRLGAN